MASVMMNTSEREDPWPSNSLIETKASKPIGHNYRQCSEYGHTLVKTQGRVVGEYVHFSIGDEVVSSVKTDFDMILPGDYIQKEAMVIEWADDRRNTNTGELQGGWGKGIVPFVEHTCYRNKRSIEETFIQDNIMSPDNFVFVNQVKCTVNTGKSKPGRRQDHRPVAIACASMSSTVWGPEHGGMSIIDISQRMQGSAHELPYVPGQTYVLDIKLLCGHQDFAGSGGNMLRYVIDYFADAIKVGYKGHHTHFICVADALDVEETKLFYERMGFKMANTIVHTVTDNDGNFVKRENDFRYVRLVRIKNVYGPGGL
jgi:hypothetical protein